MEDIVNSARAITEAISRLDMDSKVKMLNTVRALLHEASPFRNEPVDLVTWVKQDVVMANSYNPNKTAPTEQKLLEHSIRADGYTQPIVTFIVEDKREVVDGFHRNRVGKEAEDIKERIFGYLPTVTINKDREGVADRMAATIRHNRARGEHTISGMSEIILDLRKRNWSDAKIAKELGMEADEVLRLAQVEGLASMFVDKEFSAAWEPSADYSEKSIIDD